VFFKQLYRYLVLWPKALLRKVDLHRYHKHLSVFIVLYLMWATLSAIQNKSDGSWEMPVVLFHVAVLLLILGSCELMLVADKRYKSEVAKYKAISRSLSCYGLTFVIIFMCELYSYTVLY
jgi:hypothetical protein